MGIIVNKPLENLQIEGILEKLKITQKNAIRPFVWISP